MLIPVAGISLLLAMLADDEEIFSRKVRRHAKEKGWLPEPGDLELENLFVPRLLFAAHPELVPAPFAWPSSHSVGVQEHPYRTVHVFLDPHQFLTLTNSSEELLQAKRERMRQMYLPIAIDMIEGRQKPDFPPPWLIVGYRDGKPYITGHEGRHRALMAIELGLKALPIVLVIPRDPQGWEHQRDSIGSDPVVQRVTAGKPVWMWSQNHGSEARRPRYLSMSIKVPSGEDLRRELIRLQLTLDPTKR